MMRPDVIRSTCSKMHFSGEGTLVDHLLLKIMWLLLLGRIQIGCV